MRKCHVCRMGLFEFERQLCSICKRGPDDAIEQRRDAINKLSELLIQYEIVRDDTSTVRLEWLAETLSEFLTTPQPEPCEV